MSLRPRDPRTQDAEAKPLNAELRLVLGRAIAFSASSATDAQMCNHARNPGWRRVTDLLDLFNHRLREVDAKLPDR